MKNIDIIYDKRTFYFFANDFLSSLVFFIQNYFFKSTMFTSLDYSYFVDFAKLAFG